MTRTGSERGICWLGLPLLAVALGGCPVIEELIGAGDDGNEPDEVAAGGEPVLETDGERR